MTKAVNPGEAAGGDSEESLFLTCTDGYANKYI